MLPEILASVLVCTRCRGPLADGDELSCTRCGRRYPVRDGVPRMTDGAERRDSRMVAEWEAQQHAHALYVDPTFIMNSWETEALPTLYDWLGPVDGTVLDVGCGIGKLGLALTDRG